MITREELIAYLDYDPLDGWFYHKNRSRDEFATTTAYKTHLKRVGTRAGCRHKNGYVKVIIKGQYHSAHRLVWLLLHGEIPEYPQWEIDHINGNRSDNRPKNLRKVTKSENQRNAAKRTNNRSGVTGVNWVRSKRKWVARIWDGPHHKSLGAFENLEDARIARMNAERELGYGSKHGRRKTLYVCHRREAR